MRRAVVAVLLAWSLVVAGLAVRRVRSAGASSFDMIIEWTPDAGPSDAGAVLTASAGRALPQMVRVQGGEGWMGCAEGDSACGEDEKPARRLELPPFEIDRTEVRLGSYQSCVAAGACSRPAETAHCNHGAERSEHPANCLSALDAAAYCRFVHKRLPTAEEWERAARGSDGRIYPWGSAAPSCARAHFGGCGQETSAVGGRAAGASPSGALDLAGNVWEWTTSTSADGRRVIKGGSWYDGPQTLRASNRGLAQEQAQLEHVGFRCVREAVER